MKTLNKILIVLAAVSVIAIGVSYATTQRLGAILPIQYSATKTLAKTSAYTVTSSDAGALINVNATGGGVTITLPTSAVVGAMNTSFPIKVVKTDATTNVVTIAPGSGDTVGGESARKLLSQNAEIVLSYGPGYKDWTVLYETQYFTEDHKAGTYVTGIGSGGLYSAQATSTTLTDSDCGNTIALSVTGTVKTLPATIAHCQFTFVTTNTSAITVTIDTNAADQIFGTVVTGVTPTLLVIATTAGEGIVSTQAVNKRGDSITLEGDGVDGWYIKSSTGRSWAEETP